MLAEMESDFEDVLYFNDTRWLSRGKCLARFLSLLPELRKFMTEKKQEIPELEDEQWLSDLSFLVDITNHLNIFNMQLQGKDLTIVDFSDKILAFKKKLDLWVSQIAGGTLAHFPNLSEKKCTTSDLARYSSFVQKLRNEISNNFKEVELLSFEIRLFSDPFDLAPSACPLEVQLDLIDLQCNSALKNKFKGMSVTEFWQLARRFTLSTFTRLS